MAKGVDACYTTFRCERAKGRRGKGGRKYELSGKDVLSVTRNIIKTMAVRRALCYTSWKRRASSCEFMP